MTARVPDSASPEDVWLPEKAKPQPPPEDPRDAPATGEAIAAKPPPDVKPVDSEARKWLIGEPPAASPSKTTDPAEEAKRNGAATRPAETEPKEAEAELAEQRSRIAELEEQLEQREVELKETLQKREAEFRERLEEREAEYSQALRERDEALKEREAELEQQLSQGYEQREADLNEAFDQRQAELEQQLAMLEARLDVREEELREQARRREAKMEVKIEELQSQLADAKLGMSETPAPKRSRRGGSRKDGMLDLNEASFEQLRDIGLSVTQSARVVAYRDARGGFESLEELDEIPGLPKETRIALRSRVGL